MMYILLEIIILSRGCTKKLLTDLFILLERGKPGAQTEAQPTEQNRTEQRRKNRGEEKKEQRTKNRGEEKKEERVLQSPNTEPIKSLRFLEISFRSPLPLPYSFSIFEMIKTRNYRIRKSSRPSWTLTLTLLLTCCFLILILLTLRILSLTHSNSSNALSKPNDLTSIARNTHVYVSTLFPDFPSFISFIFNLLLQNPRRRQPGRELG